MNIPKDPFILLGYINTQLRDFYQDLDDLCLSLDIDQAALTETLSAVDFLYDPSTNQFI